MPCAGQECNLPEVLGLLLLLTGHPLLMVLHQFVCQEFPFFLTE